MFVLAVEQEVEAPEQDENDGGDAKNCAWVGSSLDAIIALSTAFTAFVAAVLVLAVQVVHVGATPARAPSCAARVIAP